MRTVVLLLILAARTVQTRTRSSYAAHPRALGEAKLGTEGQDQRLQWRHMLGAAGSSSWHPCQMPCKDDVQNRIPAQRLFPIMNQSLLDPQFRHASCAGTSP